MEGMKKFLCVAGLMATVFLFSCATASQRHFSLKNTLAIFILNDGKSYFFAIPVQYIGDYQIQNFEFDSGYIEIGDYKIPLVRGDLSIDVFLNEYSDESGNTDLSGDHIYSEVNGKILFSKMDEPLTKNHADDNMFNQYNIIIKKPLKNNEIKNITSEYKKGNTHSNFYIEYTITIDNERMEGCGFTDDFELYNGPAEDYGWFPPNLGFFKIWFLEDGPL
jgi:hypothetical protein